MTRAGISDEDLSRLLLQAGMPDEETPRLIGALNEFWKLGRSINEIDGDVLTRWNLSERSVTLLKAILDRASGEAQFVVRDQTDDSLLSSVILQQCDEDDEDEYDDDAFDDDDDEYDDPGVNLLETGQDGFVGMGPVDVSTSFGDETNFVVERRTNSAAVAPEPLVRSNEDGGRRLEPAARHMLNSACSDDSRRIHTARHILQGHWKLGKCIGQGSFGAVYTCMDEATGQLMAVKMMAIPMSEAYQKKGDVHDRHRRGRGTAAQSELRALCSEIELMRSFEHPNIVRYLGATVDEPNLQLYIFQEWVPGGSLANILADYGALAESVVRRYTTHILEGLVYLHQNHIIHRDIKSGNVLVEESGVAKLADFGASHRLGKDGTLTADMKLTTMRGTPHFMAPEVLQQDKFGRRSDVWSVGGVVLQMATTDPPWKCMRFSTPMALFYHVASTSDPPPMDQYDLSPSLRSFILRCFERDPIRRPHAAELRRDRFLLPAAQDAQRPETDEDDSLFSQQPQQHLEDTIQRLERVGVSNSPATSRNDTIVSSSSQQGELSGLKMRMSLRGSN